MANIDTKFIAEGIINCIDKISCEVEPTCAKALIAARDSESNATTRFALDVMCKNIEYARSSHLPVCQDTGMVVVFVRIGQDVKLDGEFLDDAINGAVRKAYAPLRKSVLDPVSRINTKDNTPAVIHTELVKGDKIEVEVMLKGFGSENMSAIYMLNPAQGLETAKDLIVKTIADDASNPCPPVIVGVGLGGTFEKCAEMSKHALFRKIGSSNPDPVLDGLEKELLERINSLGIGAQGFGGQTSALGVFIESYPTHISSLPVAVNVLCHCSRAARFSVTEGGVVYE